MSCFFSARNCRFSMSSHYLYLSLLLSPKQSTYHACLCQGCLAKEKAKDATDISVPLAIIWASQNNEQSRPRNNGIRACGVCACGVCACGICVHGGCAMCSWCIHGVCAVCMVHVWCMCSVTACMHACMHICLSIRPCVGIHVTPLHVVSRICVRVCG